MTWAEFHELFKRKYFPVTARHEKAREFLELKQGSMTMMEYVAKFIKLAHFADDYVATDTTKVRKFEDGLGCTHNRGTVTTLWARTRQGRCTHTTWTCVRQSNYVVTEISLSR